MGKITNAVIDQAIVLDEGFLERLFIEKLFFGAVLPSSERKEQAFFEKHVGDLFSGRFRLEKFREFTLGLGKLLYGKNYELPDKPPETSTSFRDIIVGKPTRADVYENFTYIMAFGDHLKRLFKKSIQNNDPSAMEVFSKLAKVLLSERRYREMDPGCNLTPLSMCMAYMAYFGNREVLPLAMAELSKLADGKVALVHGPMIAVSILKEEKANKLVREYKIGDEKGNYFAASKALALAVLDPDGNREMLERMIGEAKSRGNLGGSHADIRNLMKAVENYLEVLDLKRKIDPHYQAVREVNSLGDKDAAREFVRELLETNSMKKARVSVSRRIQGDIANLQKVKRGLSNLGTG